MGRRGVVQIVAAGLVASAIALTGNASADNSDAHGDPAGGSEVWTQQTLDDCALMATAHLIGMFTGDTPTEKQIITLASSTPSKENPGHPIYHLPTDLDHPNETGDGAATEDMPILMAHYGLTGTYTDDDAAPEVGLPTGMRALREYLDIGKAALAVADADILWDQRGAQYGPHAVVVTGIDDSNGIVHVNDSGPDNGADELVAIKDFETAWGKYGHQLIVVTE
jgi:hypothetical protein